MEIKQKTIIFILFFCGCTSNPFWQDKPTKKVNISGIVIAEERVSEVPVYVWIEDLDVSGHADTTGYFSIDIPSLEAENGNFSGSVRVFYYIHNYRASYSDLYITDGRLTSAQTDFDEDGRLLDSIKLEKLVSLDLTIDNNWNRSAGDTLIFSLDLNIKEYPVSIFAHVNQPGGQQGYEPSGVLFSLISNNETYYDENSIDFLQRYDLDPGVSITWTYYIAPDAITPFVIDDYITLDQQLIPTGSYHIRPFAFIQQDQVPDDLVQSLDILDTENISVDFFKMPLDMIEKNIIIQ